MDSRRLIELRGRPAICGHLAVSLAGWRRSFASSPQYAHTPHYLLSGTWALRHCAVYMQLICQFLTVSRYKHVFTGSNCIPSGDQPNELRIQFKCSDNRTGWLLLVSNALHRHQNIHFDGRAGIVEYGTVACIENRTEDDTGPFPEHKANYKRRSGLNCIQEARFSTLSPRSHEPEWVPAVP